MGGVAFTPKFNVLCSSDRNERIYNPEIPILEGSNVVQTIVATLSKKKDGSINSRIN